MSNRSQAVYCTIDVVFWRLLGKVAGPHTTYEELYGRAQPARVCCQLEGKKRDNLDRMKKRVERPFNPDTFSQQHKTFIFHFETWQALECPSIGYLNPLSF